MCKGICFKSSSVFWSSRFILGAKQTPSFNVVILSEKALCEHTSSRLRKDHGIYMVNPFLQRRYPSLHPRLIVIRHL